MAQVSNQVQFSWHALQYVGNNGKFSQYVTYGAVQSVLQGKPLRNGSGQKIPVTFLGKVVRIQDSDARNGQYKQGSTIKAVVDVTNNTEVTVITIVIE